MDEWREMRQAHRHERKSEGLDNEEAGQRAEREKAKGQEAQGALRKRANRN